MRLVIEAPRGSELKLVFDAETRTIGVKRRLPKGLSYPYDWGFVPGTLAEDGDPLDGMLIDSHQLYPAMLVLVRPLGVLRLTQVDAGSPEPVRNDRVVFAPLHDDPYPLFEEVPAGLQAELERFFEQLALDLNRKLHFEGWEGADAATHEVERAARRASKRRNG